MELASFGRVMALPVMELFCSPRVHAKKRAGSVAVICICGMATYGVWRARKAQCVFDFDGVAVFGPPLLHITVWDASRLNSPSVRTPAYVGMGVIFFSSAVMC